MQASTHPVYSVPSEFMTLHLAKSEQQRSRIKELEDDICQLAAHIDAAEPKATRRPRLGESAKRTAPEGSCAPFNAVE
jgi:hypothetical protein